MPKHKALLLQGYLFHPYREGVPKNLPNEINPSHLHGWWIRNNDTDLLGNQFEYALMQKPFWLTPCVLETFSLNKLMGIVKGMTFPCLVTRGHLIGGNWQETDRGFIVPDSW